MGDLGKEIAIVEHAAKEIERTRRDLVKGKCNVKGVVANVKLARLEERMSYEERIMS